MESSTMSFKQLILPEIHRSNHKQNQVNWDLCVVKGLVLIMVFITEAESKRRQNLLLGTWQVAALDLVMCRSNLCLGLFCERKVEGFGALGWRNNSVLRAKCVV